MDLDLPELHAEFVNESGECLTSMELGLLQLEERPDDAGTVDLVFRAAHTIKGNSGSLGFTHLATFAHETEDLLHRVRAHELRADSELTSLLLAATDVMKKWVSRVRVGEDKPMTAEAQDVYDRLCEYGGAHRSVARNPMAGSGNVDASASAASKSNLNTIRVQTVRMDALMNLAGELAIAGERVRRCVETLPVVHRPEMGESVENLERLLRDVHETVLGCRMVPIGPTFRRHVRTVRDLAKAKSKRVRLELIGEEVELDVSVIEALSDPLMHMIRNAIDHGFESSQERATTGKPETGTLTLRAYHERGMIVVQVSDDGAGIRRERLRARAMEMGLPAETLSDDDLLAVIFEPGFSTAEIVTETSGRGVGMDVVRRNVERVRGRIHVESREGFGTTITMRLPLTLAVIPGFVVGVAGEQFVIPMVVVDECVAKPDHLPQDSDGAGVLHVRGEAVPCVRLRDYLGFGGTSENREVVVVVEHHDGRAGFVVDEVLGESQTVIKPLTSVLRNLPGVAGMAVMGNGSVAMVLESAAIFREMERTSVA